MTGTQVKFSNDLIWAISVTVVAKLWIVPLFNIDLGISFPKHREADNEMLWGLRKLRRESTFYSFFAFLLKVPPLGAAVARPSVCVLYGVVGGKNFEI